MVTSRTMAGTRGSKSVHNTVGVLHTSSIVFRVRAMPLRHTSWRMRLNGRSASCSRGARFPIFSAPSADTP